MEESKFIESDAKKDSVLKKIPKHNWAIMTYALAILSITLIIVIATGAGGNLGLIGKTVSENKMKTLTEDFISNKLVSGAVVENISKESGIYKVVISYQGETIPVYFTKDGKYIAQGMKLVDINPTQTTTSSETEEIPKTDMPKVDLYVMSFCPYGNLAEDTLVPVYNLLKNKVSFNVHFIVSVSGNTVTSLHGQPEVDENKREACVLSEYGFDKWLSFAKYINNNCGSDGKCWQDGAKQAGLDVNKINSCVTSKGLELMKSNADASESAGANGSPTMIINGVTTDSVYKYGNSETYKNAICSAFNNAPAECSQVLSSSTTNTAS